MRHGQKSGIRWEREGTLTCGGAVCSLFGALLLAFELRSEKTDVALRTNFGFMYGNKTRTLFLVL